MSMAVAAAIAGPVAVSADAVTRADRIQGQSVRRQAGRRTAYRVRR